MDDSKAGLGDNNNMTSSGNKVATRVASAHANATPITGVTAALSNVAGGGGSSGHAKPLATTPPTTVSPSVPSPRQVKRLARSSNNNESITSSSDEASFDDSLPSTTPTIERHNSNTSNNGDTNTNGTGNGNGSGNDSINGIVPSTKRKLAIQLSNKKRAMSSDDATSSSTSAPTTPTTPLTPTRRDLYHVTSRSTSSSASSNGIHGNGNGNDDRNGTSKVEAIAAPIVIPSSPSSSSSSSALPMVPSFTSPSGSISSRTAAAHPFPHLSTPLYINNSKPAGEMPKLVSLSSVLPSHGHATTATIVPHATPLVAASDVPPLSSLTVVPLPSGTSSSLSSTPSPSSVSSSSVASSTELPSLSSMSSTGSDDSTDSNNGDASSLTSATPSPLSSLDGTSSSNDTNSSTNDDRVSTKRKTHRTVTSSRSTKRSKLDPATSISHKYIWGYLDFADIIMDGFFDAGRAATSEVQLSTLRLAPIDLNAREILLIESSTDKRLTQLLQSAKDMVSIRLLGPPSHLFLFNPQRYSYPLYDVLVALD
jgi:hypothetical protein